MWASIGDRLLARQGARPMGTSCKLRTNLHRCASAFENYRSPTKVSGVTSGGVTVYPLPNGFSLREAIWEYDYSITAGLQGAVVGWKFDASTSYGRVTYSW